jgi:hypothetical protein
MVSLDGHAGAVGTAGDPFPTIQAGVDALTTPGDVLVVRGGSYPESVRITNKIGTSNAPIHIRCQSGETVFVDGFEPADINNERAEFRTVDNDEWQLATDTDPQAHADEYVSTRHFPSGEATGVRHGAFVDREPYTRLITYSRLEDLRAENQRFGRLRLNDTTPPFPDHPVLQRDQHGNLVVDPVKDGGVVIAEAYKRPWTYLGPGLFQDDDGRIRIRLSHTANATPGIADYDGATDPRTLRLAISQWAPPPLLISGCEFVHVEGLHVRFGGNLAVRIETSSYVVLDHVDVRAASGGVRFGGGNTGVQLRHCTVDGGRPTWLFRSDVKDGYKARGDDGSVIENDLAAGTHDFLLAGAANNVDTVIEYCEFVAGHDLALFGQHTTFHHNWVHNLHDDALIVDQAGTTDLQVYQNVITNCLMAISFALERVPSPAESRSVHRNLIDLREPTSSFRPRPADHLVDGNDDTPIDGVYRYGQLYKSNQPDGPMDFFHNTCLVRRLDGPTGFGLFRAAGPDDQVRRSVNNVFVDVTPLITTSSEYVTAYLPPPNFAGPTDGNCYVQVGPPPRPLLRHKKYVGGPATGAAFDDLAAYRGSPPDFLGSPHFLASQDLYPPGFERHGVEEKTPFRSLAADGVPQEADDLRLNDASQARDQGIDPNANDVGIADPFATPGPWHMGCYPPGEIGGLDVGVDGRRRFPKNPGT